MGLRKNKEQGQALIEYLLLLIIVLVLGLGAVYQFNSAFRQFLAGDGGLFGPGGYLECLVENGLLPGTDQCPIMPMPDYRKMKPRISGGLQGNGLNGGGSTSTGNASSNGTSNNQSQGSAGSGETPSSRNVPATSADGRNGAFKGFTNNPNQGANGGGKNKAGQTNDGYTGSDKVSSGSASGEASSSDAAGSLRPRNFEDERLAAATKAQSSASKDVPATERDTKSKALLEAEQRAKRKVAASQDEPFTFGRSLRILAIILILFFVIFFVGTQIIAISRGQKR
jgi:hypothetical protein